MTELVSGQDDAAVTGDFRRNLTVFVLFDSLWGLGLPFVMFLLLVPTYLNDLGASKIIIGMGSALGALVVPLQLVAEQLIGGPHRKRNVWLVYSASGASYLIYGLLGFVLPAQPATYRIVFFFLAMIAFIGTINLGQPVYWGMLTDNCPVRWRGRLMGFRTLGLGSAGVLNFLPAQWVYRHWPSPTNYHVALVIAGLIFMGGCLSVLLIRDHFDHQAANRHHTSSRLVVRETLEMLRRLWDNPNYRVFIFFIVLLVAGYSLAPFLVTYGTDCLKIPAQKNQYFKLVYLISSPIVGIFLGTLADRWGYRLAAIILTVLSLSCFTLALLGGALTPLLMGYGMYCCIIITMPSILCNMSVELMPRENPAHLIAAGNLFCLIPAVLVPTLGGRIIDVYRSLGEPFNGYLTVFIVAIVLALVSGLGLWMLVHEPRSGRSYITKIINPS